jgi:hypothetical protein
LLDSKDEPWSAAERKFHRLLRDAGITAWKANQLVVLGGSLFFLDVVSRGVRLAAELDGRLYHSGSEVFETDRWRQNLFGPRRLVPVALHLRHDRGATGGGDGNGARSLEMLGAA